MRKTAYIAIVTLFPLLGGCGLYKKYDRQAFEYNADRIVMTDSSDTPLNNLPDSKSFKSGFPAVVETRSRRVFDKQLRQQVSDCADSLVGT